VFGKLIDQFSDSIIGGSKVEALDKSTMPLDAVVLYPGGIVTNEVTLGTLEARVYEGQAASNALALSRMTAAPESPLQRSLADDRRRNLDDRLRALGVGVRNR
jgi:hypothetical protein